MALGFCFVLGWLAGVYVGTKGERNSWKIRASSYDNKYTTAHHCDGTFYYVIEERYFNKKFALRDKPLEEQKDEWCENELKGWRDEN